QLIRSLERPSCAERFVNFPSRNRHRPPPYVPIQTLPSLSSNIACTSPTGSPFSGRKYSTVSIAIPVGPSRNVIRPMPLLRMRNHSAPSHSLQKPLTSLRAGSLAFQYDQNTPFS